MAVSLLKPPRAVVSELKRPLHGGLGSETYKNLTAIEGGSVNRCFQVGKVSRKARCGKIGRRRRPVSTARGNIICRKRAAIFSQPSFRDSPFLCPVFAIITGVLKHLFTEPPSIFRFNGNSSTGTSVRSGVTIM
jgi:hypothetical protein